MGTQDERKAIQDFVVSCTVPLAIRDSVHHGAQGTGALFRLGGTAYLVTARHVLKGLDLERVGIPTIPGPEFWAANPGGPPVKLKAAGILPLGKPQVTLLTDARLDLAAVTLDSPQLVNALERTYTFLTAGNLLRSGEHVECNVVCGFPIAVGRKVGDRDVYPPVAVWTHQIAAPHQADRLDPPDPQIDVYLEYRKEGQVSGQNTGTPQLEGVSGAVVWGVLSEDNDRGVWTAESRVRVAAFQCAYVHNRYIRAKKLKVLEDLFETIDPAATGEIRAAVARTAY